MPGQKKEYKVGAYSKTEYYFIDRISGDTFIFTNFDDLKDHIINFLQVG